MLPPVRALPLAKLGTEMNRLGRGYCISGTARPLRFRQGTEVILLDAGPDMEGGEQLAAFGAGDERRRRTTGRRGGRRRATAKSEGAPPSRPGRRSTVSGSFRCASTFADSSNSSTSIQMRPVSRFSAARSALRGPRRPGRPPAKIRARRPAGH
jgi:hypothetical protein